MSGRSSSMSSGHIVSSIFGCETNRLMDNGGLLRDVFSISVARNRTND